MGQGGAHWEMQTAPPPQLDFASTVQAVRRLVRSRDLLISVGRWARLSYRTLFWDCREGYLWRYSIESHDPRVFRLLGRVLAGLIVPSDYQALIDTNLEIQTVLWSNLPDFAAMRVFAFLNRGG